MVGLAAVKKKKGKPPESSEAERALEFQLTALKIRFEREVRFAPPRRFRIDFVIRRPDGAVLAVEVQGGVYVRGAHNRGKHKQSEGEKSALIALAGMFLMTPTGEQAHSGAAAEWIGKWLTAGRKTGK